MFNTIPLDIRKGNLTYFRIHCSRLIKEGKTVPKPEGKGATLGFI